MLFSKNVLAAAALLLSVSFQAQAHALIAPVLGVEGTPKRDDVQRPSTAKPCGNTNIAQTFDSSMTIPLSADGTFTANITNFNGGVDGSRQIAKALVDVTGTGNSFVETKVLQNGDKNPSGVGSQQLIVQVSGECQGGASKNKCLVSLTTAGNFGNCVVVEAHASTNASSTMGTDKQQQQKGASANKTCGTSEAKSDKDKSMRTEQMKENAVGTRAARAMRLAEAGTA